MLRVSQLIGFGARRSGIIRDGLQLWLDPSDYSSGQDWVDRTANGYVFNRGANNGVDAADPTHNAGPPAYWSFDGGDYFHQSTTYAGSIMRRAGRQDQPFTLEAWIYRGPTTNANEGLFSNKTSGAGDGIYLYLDYEANKMELLLDNASQIASTAQVSVGAWKHVAFAGRLEGSTTCTFYLDGAANGTGTYNNSGWTTSDSEGTQPYIGAINTVDAMQSGTRLAIFRMYDRVLTGAEILNNFTVERGSFGV